MINLTITNDDSEVKLSLGDDATSTEMIEKFCRLLLLQTYQMGSVIHSLNEVREYLIEEVKLAHEDCSTE